jgi:penicillin-binding protein 2
MLRGQSGGYVAQVNPRGQITGEYAQYRRDPVDGNSVVLTVSVDFQRDVIGIVERGIQLGFEYVEELNAEKRRKGEHIMHPRPPGAGAAVVLNPQTGEILAMVSLPGYDHRHFAEGISQAQLDAYLETNVPEEQRRHPLQNRCHALVFPPGSTIKPFMAATGLQEGKIKPDTKIRCHGWIEVPHTWDEIQRDKYYCHTRDATHGDLNVLESLAVSCDVFYYSVGAPNQKDERNIDLHYYLPNNPNPINFYGVGIEVINNYLGHFGFGQKTGVELLGEDEGLVPGSQWKEKTFPGDFWSVGDTIITSIGQGYDLVTPLQMCNATAAIANGGTLYRPTLVREVRDADDRVVSGLTPRVLRKLPIDRRHLDVVREGMRMSITDSRGLVSRTAQGVDRFPLPPNVDAGVKTGTAEYGRKDEVDELGRTLRAHAWCAAFAPFNNPQVCVVAFIEGGFGSAAVAAPVASGIINAYFARFGGQQ